MKLIESKEEQFNEIIFEKRNKEYGAYTLRTTYKKSMNSAITISVAVLLLGLTYPLIAAYFNKGTRNIVIWSPDPIPPPPNPRITPPPLPPIPPDNAIEKKIKFTPPVIVNDTVDDNTNMFQDDSKSDNSLPSPIDTIGSSAVDDKIVIKPIDLKPEPFIVVEEMPTFPGGEEARMKFIQENVVYPVLAKEGGIQGPVFISFIVETDGSISDVKILKGIAAGCDEEALRVVKMMPKWNPGKQSGKNVRVQFNIPIKFILQ